MQGPCSGPYPYTQYSVYGPLHASANNPAPNLNVQKKTNMKSFSKLEVEEFSRCVF